MPAVNFHRFAAEVRMIYQLKAPATSQKMSQVLDEFAELGIKKTSELKPVTIAQWLLAHTDRAPATNDSLLRSFRSAVAIAVASGYVKTNPFGIRIDVPDFDPEIQGKRRHHSTADVGRVLQLASDEAAGCDWKCCRREALVYTYAYAALRKNEALYLQRPDVDLKRSVFHIRPRAGRKLKTKASAADVPIAPPLMAVLPRWLERSRSALWVFPGATKVGPWDGGPPGHKPLCEIKALGRRAGVDGLTILSFRHSFATHAAVWGLSDKMVQAILRHTTTRTQRCYTHADLEDMLAAVRTVNYPPPPAAGENAVA